MLRKFRDAELHLPEGGAWLGSAVGRQLCSVQELLSSVGDVKQITTSLLAVFYGFSLV